MPDNKVNVNERPNSHEALDLRENMPSAQESLGVKKIELTPLPEDLNKISPSEKIEVAERGAGLEQAPPGGIIASGQQRQRQAARYREIENALADGLDDLYLGMDQISQDKFKVAGEEAGRAINELLSKGKYTVKKVVDIIKKWLSLLPGVNKFFLEQEAKIKADKIINLQKKYG